MREEVLFIVMIEFLFFRHDCVMYVIDLILSRFT